MTIEEAFREGCKAGIDTEDVPESDVERIVELLWKDSRARAETEPLTTWDAPPATRE